jgi:succinate dehydrogenase / fumarate reductase cytochrome b subunit
MSTTQPLALLDTGIGRKALVAATGLVLYGFVLVHALGNLQVFLGPEAINAYGAALQSMPKVVWATRLLLLACVVTHAGLAFRIYAEARAARPSRYKIDAPIAEQSIVQRYARQTMILSGPIVAAYLVFHLAHLTAGVVPGLYYKHGDVYGNMVRGFQSPLVAGFYMLANLLLGLHLYHGGVAIFQTLGLRHRQWDKRTRPLAFTITAIVTATNLAIPYAIVSGLVGSELG